MILCLINSNINKEYIPNQGYNDTFHSTLPMMLITPKLNISNLLYGKIFIKNIHHRPRTQVVHTTRYLQAIRKNRHEES